MIAKVYVTYKKEVLDPQGKTVKESLQKLGFEGVLDVRQGKYFEIRLESAATDNQDKKSSDVEKMCRKLLANPVIEDFRYEILDA